MALTDIESFKSFVAETEAQPGYARPAAFAIGISTQALGTDLSQAHVPNADAAVLDTWYPAPNCGENFGSAAVLAKITGHTSGTATYRVTAEQLDEALGYFAPFEGDGKVHANIIAIRQIRDILRRLETRRAAYGDGGATLDEVLPRFAVVAFVGDLTDEPVDCHDAYLRLHLLSSRKIQPHGSNLSGIFGKVTNVVWTNVGPFSTESFELARGELRAQGVSVHVHCIDKFPRMTDYVVPSGVRLADADRARLGAHLGEGTTVMHEGFVNFNAGTLGTSMVEGRISAGVVVGKDSDVGGGASIMGTLSGGGKMVISLGEM